MTYFRRKGLLLFLAGAIAPKLLAQQDYFDLSPAELVQVAVTVTASGYRQHSAEAPASVSIIDESAWRAAGARTVFDVLATVPGIHISNSQLTFASYTVIFRGIRDDNNAGIKLLIDGRPVEFLYSGGFVYTFDKPLSGLQRIEVIRGSGSAMYGADAFSGVINLITKDKQYANELTLRGSEHDSYDLGLHYHRAVSGLDFTLSAEYQRSDDDPGRVITGDAQTDFDRAFATAASLAPGSIDNHYEILDAHIKLSGRRWDIGWWGWRNFDAGAGPGVAQALDPVADIRFSIDFFTAAYQLPEPLLNGQVDVDLGYQRHDQSMLLRVFPAGTVLPMGADGNIDAVNPVITTAFPDGYIGKPSMETERSYITMTHLMQIGDHKIRTQTGYEDQQMSTEEAKNFANGRLDGTQTVVDGTLIDVTGTPYIYAPDSSRYFYHIAIQDDWTINEQWTLNIGVRQDHYSDFGSTTNPRLGLVWQANANTTVKAIYGSAFRAPAFQDQFNQNNPVALGNPDIDPEEIDTYELDISHTLSDNLSATVVLFHYQADNLISFMFDPAAGVSRAQNQDRLEGKGAELALHWRARDWLNLYFQHSYVDTELNGHGAAPDVPKHNSYVGGNWRINARTNLNMQLTRVADRSRDRLRGDTRPDIDDYISSRLKLAYTVDAGRRVEVALIGENIFDEKAYEPSNGAIADDYPLPGRRFWLEARARF